MHSAIIAPILLTSALVASAAMPRRPGVVADLLLGTTLVCAVTAIGVSLL